MSRKQFNQYEALLVRSVLGRDCDFYGTAFSILFVKFRPHLRGRRCFYEVTILLVGSCRAVFQAVIAELPPFWLSRRPLDEVAAVLGKSPPCVAAVFVKSLSCL